MGENGIKNIDENEDITIQDLLKMTGSEHDYEKETEIFIDAQSKYCSAVGFLVRNVNELNDRKLHMVLKTIRTLLDVSVNASYDLIKKIETYHPDVKFDKFLNNQY